MRAQLGARAAARLLAQRSHLLDDGHDLARHRPDDRVLLLATYIRAKLLVVDKALPLHQPGHIIAHAGWRQAVARREREHIDHLKELLLDGVDLRLGEGRLTGRLKIERVAAVAPSTVRPEQDGEDLEHLLATRLLTPHLELACEPHLEEQMVAIRGGSGGF